MNDGLYQAETSVLGSLILKPDLVDELYLQPEEMIADERHGLALKYLRYSYEQDGTIDLVLMAKRSGQNINKIGGFTYLTQLAQSVPTESNFGYYQAIIRNAYMQRLTANTLQSMAITSQQDGVNITEHLAAAQAKIEEIAELKPKNSNSGLKKMADTLDGHVEEIKERRNKKGMTGPPTLSTDLDKMTGGHQRGDLIIVAARPSMGKTAFMNSDALMVARSVNTAAAIFSAEMNERKVTERMICTMANLDSNKMRSGGFDDTDWQKYSYARDELDRLPLYIDDTPGMTLQHIRREVKRMVKIHPNLIVYIDYLQLISAGMKFPSRREEVEYVSRSLKQMGRQYGVTVVALAQLSRGVEQRQDKRPMMSDIKEAGGIEQDADIIIFLHRDEYYNKESDKKGIVELIIAKGRDIGVGTVEMAFMKNTGKFANLDRSHHGGNPDGRKAS